MADTAETTAERAAKEGLTHEAYLLELGRIELAAKAARRTEQLRKQSGLLPGKTLCTLNLNCFDGATRMQMVRLQSGAFIKDAINVISVGRPGTGKVALPARWAMP
jgi:DNA replication protein DnaC